MSEERQSYELQIAAMRAIMDALKSLDKDATEAVLNWVDSQIGRKSSASLESTKLATKTSSASERSWKREGTVSVVAQKMGAKSARDLLLAAASHLTLYQERENFTKDELIACAKEARTWRSDYSNQIAMNIKRMMDAGTLFEKSKNVFSLSDEALAGIEERLVK